MRLAPCFISTFPPRRCGIGAYTSQLSPAVADAAGETVTVLAEDGADLTADGPVVCTPCFSREADFADQLLPAVTAAGARVVHIQHSPDILGMDSRLLRLLFGLRQRGVRSVVTLHTVHTAVSGALERRFFPARYHRDLARLADALVVHGQAGGADALRSQRVPRERVTVIPHGTPLLRIPDAATARGRLGLPAEGEVLLYFGFIHIQKNLHTVVRALARLRGRRPNLRMLVVGSIQNRAWFNRLYLASCRELVRRLGLREAVDIREGFVPAETIPDLYGAADIVLLPYAQRYGSASGIVHGALGAGKVALCSTSPKFAEIGAAISPDLIVPTHDPDAWAARLDEILADGERRGRLETRMREVARERSWPRVGRLHVELYRRLVDAAGTSA